MNGLSWRRSVVLVAVLLAMVAATAAAAGPSGGRDAGIASDGPPGFLTSAPPMLRTYRSAERVKPILTVGDTLPNGYRFEAIPDGIAIDPTDSRLFDVYVNHETSTVPFPLAAVGSLTDFDNAQLSHLVLRRGTGRVTTGAIVIPSSANFLRFCSNFYAGRAEGFNRPLLFTNEETNDILNLPPNPAWPPIPGQPQIQAGRVVAYDPATGEYRAILGMGRHNHENAVAIPGYGHPVVLSGDDTFSAPSSQLYLYSAANADAVWNDTGHLYAFVSDDPAVNDYGDLAMGDEVSGRFIPVPDDVARGDQTALETWSNANNVFQFIRVEDLAYDRRKSNIVYFADTGEPRAIPDPNTGRLMRGPSGTLGPYPNGRVFKMVLSGSDPLVVKSLSILIDGDAGGYNNPAALHNPDNLETTKSSLMIQEDPGSHNGYAANDPNGVNARIWRYSFRNGALRPVAEVDQSADPAARLGTWESSGIVDASAIFGRGAFLVNVQAHSLWIETAVVPNPLFPGNTMTQKREGGQMLLLRIPEG